MSMIRSLSTATVLIVGIAALASCGLAANITWDGGNADWVDGVGNNANWNPADEPDANDTAIFNTANAVNMGSANSILGLTMSGGIDLSTNNQDLTLDGLIQLVDASTNLIIGGSGSLVTAEDVTINIGGQVRLTGGVLTVNEPGGTGVLTTNAGGMLSGHGTVNLDQPLMAVATLLNNNGQINAQRDPLLIFGAPAPGTLTINSAAAGARIDLDGSGENGVVNVRRNQTLDINVALADAFHGDVNLFHNSTLDISSGWTLAGGTIDVDNGFVAGVFPNPNIPAGVAVISGGSVSQSGGTITVADTDGTLRFDAAFTQSGGALVNNGLVGFNANVHITSGGNFTMPTNASSMTVDAGFTVNVDDANFNADGNDAATNVITINSGAILDLDLGAGADESLDGTINLNGGELDVTTVDNTWAITRSVNVGAATGASQINGEQVTFTGAAVTVGASATLDMNAASVWSGGADLAVAAGAAVVFDGDATFSSAANTYTGGGALVFNGDVNIAASTTFDMTGGTVSLDGNDLLKDNQVNVDAPLVVNALGLDAFGKTNRTNILDIDNTGALTGALTVNLTGAATEWTLNNDGVMNLLNDNAPATLLAGADVNIHGTINVTGDVRTTARLDMLTADVNINTAGEPFRLGGGNNTDDPNVIVGVSTINGPGRLGADDDRALRGSGTINADIDFDGDSHLIAAGSSVLHVNGAILDIGTLRTSGAAAVLDLAAAFNTSVTDDGILMEGGTLQGAQITTASLAKPLRGNGTVTSAVINTGAVEAQGGTLVLDNTANDWDGVGNAGQLRASGGGTLELRDNVLFGFLGSITATGGSRVFANNFALDFNPGSTLNLTGATYESTNTTDLGGAVNIAAGSESTIKVQVNRLLVFESTSVTTLNGNLQLLNNNIGIDAGATFSGTGAVVIPDGSHLVVDANANINVLLDNQGAFRPAGFDAVGRVDLKDYQQLNTGELFVELRGTGLNQFDRLVVNGSALLDGYLNIDIDGGFVPALGNTFNILTANTVSGTFDFVDVSGMPAGLTFHLNYLANAVQLQVVTTPLFSADFDNDGDVDATDLSIWDGAFDLNQLGDADGDNDSDGADFLAWQRQLGSVPVTPAVGAVPEPGAFALLSMACWGLALRARRQTVDQLARRSVVPVSQA